jgi:hypothetical protein
MIPSNRVRQVDPLAFLKNHDFSHSFKGIVAGLVVLGVAIANLSLFFGLYTRSNTEVNTMIKTKMMKFTY